MNRSDRELLGILALLLLMIAAVAFGYLVVTGVV